MFGSDLLFETFDNSLEYTYLSQTVWLYLDSLSGFPLFIRTLKI
jgi:hypothetical protein